MWAWRGQLSDTLTLKSSAEQKKKEKNEETKIKETQGTHWALIKLNYGLMGSFSLAFCVANCLQHFWPGEIELAVVALR